MIRAGIVFHLPRDASTRLHPALILINPAALGYFFSGFNEQMIQSFNPSSASPVAF